MVTQVAFTALVAAVGMQRVLELRRSRRNEARLRARGARESAPEQVAWMKVVHAGWLVSMPLEVIVFRRAFAWPRALVALALFLAGQGLRYAAIRRLGELWTVRILTVPGAPVVTSGVYRWLRHPNYTGVVLEIAALPLVHTAWMTSLAFSAANLAVLRRRVAAEEAALVRDTEYGEEFHLRPRRLARLSAG